MLHSKKSLPEVHLLRATASLMVAAFHIICGNAGLFAHDNYLKEFSRFGYIGVEVFFILSGYVICYALPENYSIKNSGTFFLKRIVRIEPPYIASIILILCLNSISYRITNTENNINWWNILGHLAYINNFNGGSYINVVYWTLGIEFQFYLLIGFLFPLLRRSDRALYIFLFLSVIMACITIPQGIWLIIPYLSYFGIGILLYFYKIIWRVPTTVFLSTLLLFLLQIYLFSDLTGFLASICSIVAILLWNRMTKIITFFSAISISLYLVHVPIGGRVINLGLRFISTNTERYLLVCIALVASITVAWIFYRLIEKPSMMLSKGFMYNDKAQRKTKLLQMNDSHFPVICS
jgi:peptidoglycan/LPS O-acetylase OafA/YrhL